MALEEDSLQEVDGCVQQWCFAKEWSHASVVKAITLWSQVGPGKRHLRGYAAGSGRKAATVDILTGP